MMFLSSMLGNWGNREWSMVNGEYMVTDSHNSLFAIDHSRFNNTHIPTAIIFA